MKTYTKRIALAISARQTLPAGGMGQFVKGFLDMAQVLNWKVDIITDKETANNKPMFDMFRNQGANIVVPDDIISNKEHTEFFTFGDSYCLVTITNFKNAMFKALQTNYYDCILHNSIEFVLATHSMGLTTPVICYTHHPETVFLSQNNLDPSTYIDEYFEMFFSMSNVKNIILGTQSQRNADELIAKGHDAISLPLPLPEQGLLVPWTGPTEGVLFIGRWEDRKKPKAFIDLIRDTGFPAKVMTSKNGVEKFSKALKEIGAIYDVRANIMHQEKVDFIRSSRVMFMPSNKESYGLAMLECIGHCPVVVHEGYSWPDNFNSKHFTRCNKSTQADTVRELYNAAYDKPAALAYVAKENSGAYTAWESMFEHKFFAKPPFSSNKNKIGECDDFYLSDYINGLGRKFAYDDHVTLCKKSRKWNVVYTDNDTWFSSTGKPPVEKDPSNTEMFGNLFG